MNSLAMTGHARRWITKLHRWSGLFLLLFLFVAGVTGAILSFKWELDRAINPQLFAVEPQATALTYTALMEGVERRFPDLVVSTLVVPKTPQQSAIVYVKSRMAAHVTHVHVMGMKNELDFNQVFVDPYTGKILGQRNTTRFALTWESFIPDMVRLHYTLFLDEFGVWLMGVSALVWFLTSFLGTILIWPAAWRSFKSWKPLLSMRTRSGSYKLNYDLHRTASLVTLPILLVVAFTSVYLNLPGVVKPVIKAVSPVFSSASIPSSGRMDLDSPRVTVEQAIAVATQAMPNGRNQSVGRDFIKGLYSVRMKLPGDVSASGNNTVYVRMADGQIVFQRKAADASAGDVFSAWQYPLHSGEAFGLLGQCLICFGAIALVAMCVTGLNVWLRKRRSVQKRSKSIPPREQMQMPTNEERAKRPFSTV